MTHYARRFWLAANGRSRERNPLESCVCRNLELSFLLLEGVWEGSFRGQPSEH
jgi:hypothetical protein